MPLLVHRHQRREDHLPQVGRHRREALRLVRHAAHLLLRLHLDHAHRRRLLPAARLREVHPLVVRPLVGHPRRGQPVPRRLHRDHHLDRRQVPDRDPGLNFHRLH